MKVDIIPIGNSKGIRIPKMLLEQCGFGESVDIAVEDNHLVISPANEPRKGWDEAFKSMAAKKDDKPLDPYAASAFDKSEWQW